MLWSVVLVGLGLFAVIVNVFADKWWVSLAGMFLAIGAMMMPDVNEWVQWAAIVLAIACFGDAVIRFWQEVS